jgi:hypothetical protein
VGTNRPALAVSAARANAATTRECHERRTGFPATAKTIDAGDELLLQQELLLLMMMIGNCLFTY